MKKCKRCGALQNDAHVVCVDCGERLGPALSKQEEIEADLKVAKKISKLSNKTDYFHVTILDKFVAAALAIGAFLNFLIRLIWADRLGEADISFILLAIILMLVEALDLSLPVISWELYKLKFMFTIDNLDDLQPSVIALYSRKIMAYSVFFAGYVYLIYLLIKIIF